MKSFGEFFKEKRMALGKTLREFCLENGLDPGNISKLERGKMSPPTSQDKLKQYAEYLHIDADSEDWQTFMDLASTWSGRIPADLQEKETLARLPVFFRTIRDNKFSEEKLDQLLEKIKES